MPEFNPCGGSDQPANKRNKEREIAVSTETHSARPMFISQSAIPEINLYIEKALCHKSANSHRLLYVNDVGSNSSVGPRFENQKYWHLLIVESLVLNNPVQLPHMYCGHFVLSSGRNVTLCTCNIEGNSDSVPHVMSSWMGIQK